MFVAPARLAAAVVRARPCAARVFVAHKTYYAKTHEYIKVCVPARRFVVPVRDGGGVRRVQVDGDIGTVGLTKFAAGELGDVVYVGLPSVGATFKAGAPFADVESVKSASQLYAPVGGTVTEVRGPARRRPRRGVWGYACVCARHAGERGAGGVGGAR